MPLQAEAEGKSGHGRGIFFWGTVTVLARSVEVTGLLKAWSGGDQAALERLADQVYNELRRIARRYMRNERAGNTLQTTALVNEVYLRLVDVKNVDWQQYGLVNVMKDATETRQIQIVILNRRVMPCQRIPIVRRTRHVRMPLNLKVRC